MLFQGQAEVLSAYFVQHAFQRGAVRHRVGGQAPQIVRCQPLPELGRGQGGQQHAARGRGMGGQAAAQVQAVRHEALAALVQGAARDDDHLMAIAHHAGKRQLGLRRQPVQHGLDDARQPRRRQVAARQPQHLGRQPEMAAIRLQITQVRQGQQMAARGRARDARALGRHGGVQALALGVEALQHGQALGQSGDEVIRVDGKGLVHGRGGRACR